MLDRWLPVVAMATATAIVLAYIAWARVEQGGSILPLFGAGAVGALLVIDTGWGALSEELAARRSAPAVQASPVELPRRPNRSVAQAALDRLAA